MSIIQVNPQLVTFRDNKGPYVEVLGIVGNNLVLIYAEQKVDTVELTEGHNLNLKVGDKLYFNSSGEYNPDLKEVKVDTGVSSSNRQSPPLMRDKLSRI